MTRGENFVRTIDVFVNDYDLKGCVVAGVTDCEPSMTKASSTLTDTGVIQAADRLAEFCAVLCTTSLKVAQDMETRW